MSDILNRKEIASGVFLSRITDSRFKQNRISVYFMTCLDSEKASVNSVVPRILTNSCRLLPDLRALNARLSALYAARLSEGVTNIGDTQCVSIGVTTIDDRYALEGESVLSDGVEILLNCIFDPLIENNGFKPSVTETEKQSCIDQIEAELNEKREYAIKQATELLCEGEPFACRATVEGVEQVTPQSAYAAYEKLLKTSRIEIFCAGCNDFSEVEKTLTKAFCEMKREKMEDCYSEYSPLKPEPITRYEELEVNQSKMVIGFKTQLRDIDALVVMTKIYGGSATSKLFENVREKMSLCYYCWAKYNYCKGVIMAECGVETENIDKARAEILNQLDLIKNSDFTEDELLHARLSLQNDLKALNDKLSGIALWYLIRIYQCDIVTPEQMVERYLSVTREQIIEAAKSLSLDTVYILTEES
ncbi:MAG: insulinase family protein [Oscillospiraceae bacterium]|nr:insulinase family protein [Oscillospiraceae bacterium]